MKFLVFDIEDYKKNLFNKKIILYGTAWMAYLAKIVLKRNGINDIMYSNYDGLSYEFVGLTNTLSFYDLLELYKDNECIILWTVAEYTNYESKDFINNGIDYVYSIRNIFENLSLEEYPELKEYYYEYEKRDDYFFFEDVIQNTNMKYIYSIDAMVTERCTLRCKDCSNLMQYYHRPQNYDVDNLIMYLKKVLDVVDRIHDIRILGGEPFVNKDFVKIIDSFAENDKVDRITVLSNATVFPSDEILDKLKNKKIVLRFSDYDSLSRSLNKWTKWAFENGVRFQVSKMDVWQDLGGLKRRDYSVQKLKDLYGNCECRNTPTIIGNKLFNCAYAANASNLGAMIYEEAERDRLLIDNDVTGEMIDHFLYDRDYLEACRYCGGRNQNRAKVLPHIQTSKPLEYERLLESEKSVDIDCSPHEIHEIDFDVLVSIVIPMYNASNTIEKCINSVINQSYRNIELILVDDGSIDDTVQKCEKYLKRNDDLQIELLKLSHRGVVKTRNTGIEYAHGNYITFIDSDDWIEKDHIYKLVYGMKYYGSEMCFDCWYIDRKNKKVADSQFDRGQSMVELPYDYPKSGSYKNGEVLQLMIDHMVVKWDGLFEPLWNKMFITEKLRNIFEVIDDQIVYGEDVLYVFLYLLSCKSIYVLNYVGYHYVGQERSVSPNKYDFDAMSVSLRSLRQVLDGNRDSLNVAEKRISDSIFYRCLDVLITKINSSNRYSSVYYYPYFGRFDKTRIALYGAGDVGQSFFRSIKMDHMKELVLWVDINAEKIRTESKLPVEGIENLTRVDFDYIIVAVYSKKAYEKIKVDLVEKGLKEEQIIWNPTKKLTLYL